jgi:hypothetical protein
MLPAANSLKGKTMDKDKKTNALIALVVCVAFVQLLDAQTAGRVVRADERTPLPQMVRSDDELVIVRRSGIRTPGLTESRTARHTLERDLGEMLRSDAIFVADVRDRRSYLVDGDTWIRSSIQMSIVLTIRDAQPTLTNADRLLVFERNSGEIRVGKALVRAGDMHHFEPGARYLLGLKRFDAGGPPVLMFWYRVAPDGQLVRHDVEIMNSQPNSVLYGRQLSEVMAELAKRIAQ